MGRQATGQSGRSHLSGCASAVAQENPTISAVSEFKPGAGERGFEPRKPASALWHGVPGLRASGPHLFAVRELRDRNSGPMSIRERPAGAGLRELETFGRRLVETQGVSGDARVDWGAYGGGAPAA